MNTEYTWGLDVSHYEPVIDWKKMKAAGVKFVYAKASQGEVPDDYFISHRNGAESVGIPFGGFHFYDPRYRSVKPTLQAEIFWDIMQEKPSQLPFVVDLEKYLEGPWIGWRNWYDFLERLKALAPEKEIIIYTGYYFWTDHSGLSVLNIAQNKYFSQYPLWLARYPREGISPTSRPPSKYIPLPWKSQGWTFWQYADELTLDGVKGENNKLTSVDMDYFNGKEDEFYKRFEIDEADIPEPLPDQPPAKADIDITIRYPGEVTVNVHQEE